MSTVCLKGGKVADGATRKVFDADVLIEDGVIVAVGKTGTVADEVYDCTGCIVTAGYADAHVHIESGMILPPAFGEAVLPHGTTLIIADPHEVVNVAGAKGLEEFLELAAASPADIRTVLPSSVPATPLDTNGAGKFLAEDMKPFLSRPDVVGLGEVMCYYDVAAGNPDIMDKIALFAGRTVDGHTAGMPDDLVEAYAAAGVKNNHECTDEEEMLRLYDAGMNIYIREGSAARNARALLKGVRRLGLDISRFAFCTDDKHLSTIAAEGHIDYIVRMALEEGFSFGEAAAMASYNPAVFYGLKNKGRVAVGYDADIVVTDEKALSPRLVFKGGKLAAKDGKAVFNSAKKQNKPYVFANTVKMRELNAADFTVPESLAGVAVGLVDGQLLTTKESVADGERPNLLATVERHGKNGNIAVCYLKNYGLQRGAVATSVSHDSHNVVCAGANPEDMAVACNRLRETGGGYVVADGGRVTDELPLAAYGLMSTAGAEETADNIARLEKCAHALGVNPAIDPFITLSFTALPVIPRLRLLDTGLYDTETRSFIR